MNDTYLFSDRLLRGFLFNLLLLTKVVRRRQWDERAVKPINTSKEFAPTDLAGLGARGGEGRRSGIGPVGFLMDTGYIVRNFGRAGGGG